MTDQAKPIAHTAWGADGNGNLRDPHDLADHLRTVAALAEHHAEHFKGEEWGAARRAMT